MLPRSLVALAAFGFLLAGCGAAGSTTTVTVTKTVTTTTTGPKPPGALSETANVKYFGIPVSMHAVDRNLYELTVKPEFFLGGATANGAFAASHGGSCDPRLCPPVVNDYWRTPAGTQNLTFLVAANTKGTVLETGSPAGTTVTAAQLNELVNNPAKQTFPFESGLWFTVDVDTVTRFAQQFEP